MYKFLKEKAGIAALAWLVLAIGIAANSNAYASQQVSIQPNFTPEVPHLALVEGILEMQLSNARARERAELQESVLTDIELTIDIQPAVLDSE